MKSIEKTKHIVIAGGGTAGIMLANRLRKNLAAREADITVIERRRQHDYQTGWLTLLFDIDKPENLTRNVSELVTKGVDILIDEAKSIDASRKLIKTRSGSVPYDYLVIATGAKLLLDEPAGMKEGLKEGKSVFTFYTQEHALKLRDALRRCTRRIHHDGRGTGKKTGDTRQMPVHTDNALHVGAAKCRTLRQLRGTAASTARHRSEDRIHSIEDQC
jgi:NADH dehydrogenase FAD-containing subunit